MGSLVLFAMESWEYISYPSPKAREPDIIMPQITTTSFDLCVWDSNKILPSVSVRVTLQNTAGFSPSPPQMCHNYCAPIPQLAQKRFWVTGEYVWNHKAEAVSISCILIHFCFEKSNIIAHILLGIYIVNNEERIDYQVFLWALNNPPKK